MPTVMPITLKSVEKAVDVTESKFANTPTAASGTPRKIQMTDYPDPTEEDLQDPVFEAVWQAIKGWDLSREPGSKGDRLYAGATGNDVMHILKAIEAAGWGFIHHDAMNPAEEQETSSES